MQSRKELLKQALDLLIKLDIELENQCPEWYSSSNLIAEVNDFYNIPEIAKLIN